MRRKLFLFVLLCLLLAQVSAHDLFLKFNSYFLRPDSSVTVRLLNGLFTRSENAVARDRMLDVSLIAPAGRRTSPPSSAWKDIGPVAVLDFQTGEAGTYIVGVSTRPRDFKLKAAQFNDYLRHDGVPDTLAERKRAGQLNKDARERYAKHVKAIFQVGDKRSDEFKTALGYPVEIIPRQNPYDLKAGDTLEVLCMKDGQPIANQFVMAGRESGNRTTASPGVRSDANGIARIKLAGRGKWFVKFIHMTELDDPKLDYESKWASLTFEIRSAARGRRQ
ncbi:MAG: DUF4198 domain-containing protein [Blastocatellia bacterium]